MRSLDDIIAEIANNRSLPFIREKLIEYRKDLYKPVSMASTGNLSGSGCFGAEIYENVPNYMEKILASEIDFNIKPKNPIIEGGGSYFLCRP